MEIERVELTTIMYALEQAKQFLDWIGYGDSYEKDCAKTEKLEETLERAIEIGNEALEEIT
jgi:hypothetical protein